MRAIDRLIEGSLPFLVSAALIALIAAFASVFSLIPQDQMKGLERRLAAAYLVNAMAGNTTGAWVEPDGAA